MGISQELERLRSEQIRLSSELESLLASYDGRTRALALKLVSADTVPSDRDLQRAYEEQLRLWNIVRRLQTAERTIPQLEQEYAEWSERTKEEISALHPDHPSIRMELIASELRVRGKAIPQEVASASYEGSAKDADPFADLNICDEGADMESPIEPNADSLNRVQAMPVTPEMRDALIDQIRECGRQLRKQSVHPESSLQDLAELYAELRHHHAHLRRMDRRTGTRRYRVVLHE